MVPKLFDAPEKGAPGKRQSQPLRISARHADGQRAHQSGSLTERRHRSAGEYRASGRNSEHRVGFFQEKKELARFFFRLTERPAAEAGVSYTPPGMCR